MADALIEQIKKAVFELAEYYPEDKYNLSNYVRFNLTDEGLKTRIEKYDPVRKRSDSSDTEGRRLREIRVHLHEEGFNARIVSWRENERNKIIALAIETTFPLDPETPSRIKKVRDAVYADAANNDVSSVFGRVQEMLTEHFSPETAEQMMDVIMARKDYVPKGRAAVCDKT